MTTRKSSPVPVTLSRRDALKQLGLATLALPVVLRGPNREIVVGGQPVEIAVSSVSPRTVRVTLRPITPAGPAGLAATGALVQDEFAPLRRRAREATELTRVAAGDLVVRFTEAPPTLHIATADGRPVQKLTLDAATPGMSFLLPQGPLLGLGEGGVQFDKKGSTDQMRNGQVTSKVDGYALATHGTRAPLQWLVGTDGWAMFIHQPYGNFDFTGKEGRFTPSAPPGNAAPTPTPLDIFVVSSADPVVIMREYARITGLPEMPPRWSLGYLQSSRTLAGRDEVMSVAKTFRDKRLPCDGLIYLGTEFTPSGWNTRNGEFSWHPTNFPDPQRMIEELHAQHFKVIFHVVIEGRRLTGTVNDPCTAPPIPPGRLAGSEGQLGQWPPERQISCYWPAHKPLVDLGVDGWWPDQGDGYDGPSRFNRHRMYWEGMQLYRPNERPFALHRNASAGIQRFGGYIWSGDVQTRWETLRLHVPIAVNTSLSGLPYWGTDIGGFNPTADYTAELHIRWFQFGAFNPLFRSHGRQWHLRLPWGWDGGDGGPVGDGAWKVDPAELTRPEVEVILRKYLELRYRLMPYLYTAVRECHETGLPIMRALWLHYPDDATAVARGDEFLWGRDLLVAPVVEKGATMRKVYLPRGTWIDFWTNEAVAGGREIERAVDLEATPLYVRAGAVLPLDPVRQYTDEPVAAPMTLTIYPGASGVSRVYEDDGRSFDHTKGEWMGLMLDWDDRARRLGISLQRGSRQREPWPRELEVRMAGQTTSPTVRFAGRPIQITF
jgi:alpha-glucosidase (family GH31 glycosyl hydrolase)